MKKITNWIFGSMFRTFGRIIAFIVIGGLFAYLLSNDIIRIPQLFGIMKVNASVSNVIYDLDTNPTYFTFAAFGNPHGTTTQACYGGSDIDWNAYPGDTLINNSNLTGSGGLLTINGLRGGFKTEDLWQGNSDTLQNVFQRFEFQINTNTNGTFQSGIDYYVAIQLVSSHKNFWDSLAWVYNENPTINGTTYPYNAYAFYLTNNTYIPYPSNNFDITTDIYLVPNGNESTNVAWIVYKVALGNSFSYGIPGFVLDLWLPSTTYAFCSDNAGYWFGEENWLYINNAIVFDDSFTTSQLDDYIPTFDNNNYFVPTGYPNPDNGGSNNPGFDEIIIDDDVSEAIDSLSSWFSEFTSSNHGLSSIITAPLSAIQSLTSQTCSPLVLPLPYLDNKTLTLPCMRSIYVSKFGSFMTLYDTITFGIVSYWIIVRLLKLVKDFKNPDHDEIEVVDL